MLKNAFPLFALAGLLVSCGASTEIPETEAVDALRSVRPIRALMVTGGCCHDYENQKRIISEGVSDRINVDWTIVHHPGTGRDHKLEIFQKGGWGDDFDVVVHNTCYGGVKDEAYVGSIVRTHQEKGIGAVVLHCGLHSYRNLQSKAWHKFLGQASSRHERGAPVPVENARPDHPIMLGFPDDWTTPKDELYVVKETWPGHTVLGRAWGEETKIHHSVIWTFQSGQSRVFGASIGHSNDTMSHPDYLDLVSRGLLWTVGKLDGSGMPKSGYGPPASRFTGLK